MLIQIKGSMILSTSYCECMNDRLFMEYDRWLWGDHGACHVRNNMTRVKWYRTGKRGLGKWSPFYCEQKNLYEINQCEWFQY